MPVACEDSACASDSPVNAVTGRDHFTPISRRRTPSSVTSSAAAGSPRSPTASSSAASSCTAPDSAPGSSAPGRRTRTRSSASRPCPSRSPRRPSCCCATPGALALDDPAAQYVPELAGWTYGSADAAPVTIRQLLTMTAGFPTDDPWGDRQQGLPITAFDELLAGGVSFNWAPGTRFEYSNLGYAILGRVVTMASGVLYDEFIRTRLLAPLGLSRTGFDADEFDQDNLAAGYRHGLGGWDEVPFDPYGAFAPMGGVFSTVADLARWVAGFAAAFPPDGRRDGTTAQRRAPAPPGLAAADAAAAGGHRLAGGRAAAGRPARAARVLRLRPLRRRGPGPRPGGLAQRRLPGVRLQHALAPGHRHRRDRPRQRHLRPDVPADRPVLDALVPASSAYQVALAPAASAGARQAPPGRRPSPPRRKSTACSPTGTTPPPTRCSPRTSPTTAPTASAATPSA